MTETRSVRDHIDLTPGAAAGSDARTMILVIYGLYFAGFITGGVTTIVGVVLAYVGRGSAPDWADSHYSFQIRTFWMTLVAAVALTLFAIAAVPLVLVLVGLAMLLLVGPLFLALAVWYGVRCAVGFNHALNSRAYPNPQTLTI
jgi:uncharacterized membrane protein